jgi:vacuolar-type H+-ATPase subunit F/Vma7
MEKREIHIVGDELTATGFRLAGLKSHSISQENRQLVLDELKGRKALIIVANKAAKILGEDMQKLKETSLTLTVPEEQGEGYSSLRRLIKDTIGFELKQY